MRVKIFYYCAFLILLISCEDSDLGETTRTVSLNPFHIMKLNSVFEVYLLQSESFSAKVTGNAEVVDDIKFNIEGDTLSISSEFKSKWLRPGINKVKLYVASDQLHRIEVYESCYIETIDPIIANDFNITLFPAPKMVNIDLELNNNSFYYWNNHQCGGKLRLRGTTHNIELYSFALMSVDASQLRTDYALVQNSSRGDCRVKVQQQLEYSIHDVGNIYLYGAPDEIILKERTSTGKLIYMN